VLKGFREFIMRGNVVDLAVGIVIGIAFGAVVKSFVDGIINPLIAAIFGKPNLDSVGTFTINHSIFSIGIVLTQLVNFVLVAAAVYFFVVVPVNKLRARYEKPADAAGPSEVELLTEIRDALRTRG
jgi:large conductance mechanosensitive channel